MESTERFGIDSITMGSDVVSDAERASLMRDWNMIKCHICGKEKCVTNRGEYAYKRGTNRLGRIYFCSWSCLRSFDNGHVDGRENNGGVKNAKR